MKRPVFLDTGAIYSLADARDLDHAAVRAVYNDPERSFVLHELILVEAFSLLTKRLSKQTAFRIVGAFRHDKLPLISCARFLNLGSGTCSLTYKWRADSCSGGL